MKILFFNYEYPPLGGGAANATLFLLKEYSKMDDLEVDLITSSIDKDYHFDRIGERIRIYRLPIGKEGESVHFQTKKDLIVYSWKAFWFSQKLMKKNKYNLTHSFFTVPCGALSWFIHFTRRIPYVISLRGSDVPGYSERFDDLYKLLMPLIKSIWKNANVVLANSEGLRELALKTYPEKKIGVISNGVDIEKFDPKRYANQKEEDFFKIICGTRVTPRKGFRFLIKAVEKMKERGNKVLLDIIGEGNEKEELERLVKKKKLESEVNFVGVVDHDEIPKYFAQADIFVSSSLNEGMANAMLEALAMGLPIIATDIGGTKELVDDGVNGLIIKKENVDDLVEKIEEMKKNSEMRKRMSAFSRKKAESMTWEKVAKQYRQVYKKAL